jgi:hypothetical protein
MLKHCPHCQRPLITIVVCRWCGKEVDPIKLSTLVLVAGAILVVGVVIGVLSTL